MYATLPESCTPVVPTATYSTPGAFIERTTIVCDGGIIGKLLAIQGLDALLTDVLVRVQFLDESSILRRLSPNAPSFSVPAAPSAYEVARTYLVLGVEHILSGIDHLLFVLALLLLVKNFAMLFKTITAFTVAHSITLALASLGFVQVPGAPVEAVIALSILFLASEIAHSRKGNPGWTERFPWVVAFTFGLLHGFGFAGALAEVGLPQTDIPLALFLFNVGVELGQMLFVAAAVAVVAVLKRVKFEWPEWAWHVPHYGIGTLAAFWCIQRIAAFF
jgi:hydrogenase/urease accessory protein HupE